jgi:peptidoglycan/LPS O-acetylase OafA/YrhL
MSCNYVREEYPWIDGARFFFCTCIIFMHIGTQKIFPDSFAYYLEKGIFRLAVPFFFVVSGFMLEMKIRKKANEVVGLIKQYIKRLILPYIFFESINVLLRIISMVGEHNTLSSNVREIIKNLIFYPYGALWYIWACIIGVLLLCPFIVYGKRKLALLFGIVLYGFALSCNNYYELIPDNMAYKRIVISYINLIGSARNGLFVGFVFLNIGMFCYDIKKIIGNAKYAAMLVCAYAAYLFEIKILHETTPKDDGSLYIMTLIVIPLLVICLSNCKLKFKRKLAVDLRHYSAGMYFTHKAVRSIVNDIAKLVQIKENVIGLFIIVYCLSAMICFAAYHSHNRKLGNLFM